jgi:AraC-like DNA-binding protein
VSAWAARYAARFHELHVVPPAIRAAQILRTRAAESWPLERLCVAAGSSRSNFRRRFERVYGVSPHQFQTRLRLHAAAVAIRERDSKIEAVARSVGYGSTKDMYAVFRDVLSAAPAALRGLSAPAFDDLLRGALRVMEAFERGIRAERVRSNPLKVAHDRRSTWPPTSS